jgi:DegV family protein with EDD domain
MTAAVGTALDIKPILHVDDEGHLIPVFRVRGRKKSIKALVDHMLETCINPEEQIIFIGHGDSSNDAVLLESLVRDKFQVKDVIINNIGPIIGTHSGPGTIALFFFGTKK